MTRPRPVPVRRRAVAAFAALAAVSACALASAALARAALSRTTRPPSRCPSELHGASPSRPLQFATAEVRSGR